MLSLNGYKFCLCTAKIDMRMGSHGLAGVVTNFMQYDAADAKMIYIFFNKSCNTIKLLLWDEEGYALYQKRLTRGTYAPPEYTHNGAVELSRKQLSLILDGIEIKYRRRYRRGQ